MTSFLVDLLLNGKFQKKLFQIIRSKNFLYKLDEKKFIPENTFHHNNIYKNTNGYWSHLIFRKIMNYRLNKLNELKLSTKKSIKYFSDANFNNFNVIDKNIINFSLFKKIVLFKLSFDKKIIFHLKIKNFF